MADSKGSLNAPDFDLRITLVSGQVFGWKEFEGWYYGEIAGKPTRVRQESGILLFEGASKKEIAYYFALDEDSVTISKRISRDDSALSKAVKESRDSGSFARIHGYAL